MNGRIYDPLLGRFLSADTLVQFPGNLQSYNRYAYVQNNPLTFKDDTGHFINFLIGAAAGAIIDVGGQMTANYLTGKSVTDISWKSVGVSAAIGATGVGLGEVAAKAGASLTVRLAANAGAGAVEGAIGQVANNAIDGKSLTDGVGKAAAIGAASSVGGDLAGAAIKKLRGGAEAAAETATKKAENVAGSTPHADKVAAEAHTTPTASETGKLNPVEAPTTQVADTAKTTPHGNSAASEKAQHGYVIKDKDGNVVKTGISGQELNANGSSPRANRQVNALNKQGEGGYTAEVIYQVKEGPGARQAALEAEEKVAAQNIATLDEDLHKRPRP